MPAIAPKRLENPKVVVHHSSEAREKYYFVLERVARNGTDTRSKRRLFFHRIHDEQLLLFHMNLFDRTSKMNLGVSLRVVV